MKTHILIIIALLGGVLIGASLKAEDVGDIPFISVSGEGQVSVDPDIITLSLDIQTINKVIADAKQENDELLQSLQNITELFAIDRNNINVSYFSIHPVYEDWQTELEIMGYRVTRSISIKVTEIEKYNAIMEALIESGITEVTGIEYNNSRKTELYEQARELALQKALNKAKQMASVYSMKVGKALEITEGFQPYISVRGGRSNSANYAVSNMSGAEVDLLGKVTYYSSVNVVFELLEK